jgi:uncharacterized protein YbjT (DUF2867 family)
MLSLTFVGRKQESQAAGKTSRMSTSKLARNVAKACKNNPNVIRLIHFSSAGAAPDSPSLDLQTKYYGEQEVLGHLSECHDL